LPALGELLLLARQRRHAGEHQADRDEMDGRRRRARAERLAERDTPSDRAASAARAFISEIALTA
jgi:hypothetical protein